MRALLQQLAALRGAATSLMAEVFESHLRETFGQAGAPDELDRLSRLARSFLK